MTLESTIMLLSAAIPGDNPGDIHRHDAGFVNFVRNFKPGMGGLDCLCIFVAGSPGDDPRDL